jgi:hypothetical protein
VFVGDRDDGIAGRLESTRLKGLQVSWPDIILGSEGRPIRALEGVARLDLVSVWCCIISRPSDI